MNGPGTSACRSCGARIYWAETAAGKIIPIDEKPVDDGNVILTWSERAMLLKAHVLKSDDVVAPERNRYVTHFTTCPNAKQHRRSS